MKICLISFDSVYFDHNIILELKRRNIDTNHIDSSKFQYRYTSIFEKISNFFKKIFLKKNIKKTEMEKDVLKHLEEFGHSDVILMIRPDQFSKETHLKIKKQTDRYISYIYDSCTRFPIDHLLNGIFDEIFSFDLKDSKKYGFTSITNYIYNEKKDILPSDKTNGNIFIIMSIDERLPFLNRLANYLSEYNIDYKFIIVDKKKPKNINKNIIHLQKAIQPKDYKEDFENSKIFLDLIRKGHNGLSFRIFEALAMQRKIITTNKSIAEYDFYNPNNILILDENKINIDIPTDFLTSSYHPINDEVYHKYTIENWVKVVFNL